MSDQNSTVKSLRVSKLQPDEEVEGLEVMQVRFAKGGPIVLVSGWATEELRGKDGITMREIILDSIKATLDKICTH